MTDNDCEVCEGERFVHEDPFICCKTDPGPHCYEELRGDDVELLPASYSSPHEDGPCERCIPCPQCNATSAEAPRAAIPKRS